MNQQRLESILAGLGIQFQSSPKAVNINCPFCVGSTHGQRDAKYRCGIFPRTLSFHCFRCKRKGGLYDLLHDAVGLPLGEYRNLVGETPMPTDETPLEAIQRLQAAIGEAKAPPKRVALPSSRLVTSDLLKDHPPLRRFLEQRNISVQTCFAHGARYTGDGGDYPQRMILPILDDDGDLRAFQARDVTGKAKTKYLTQGPISELLYKVPFSHPKRIYVVEGIFDCWRMGENAVATFTHGISSRQRALLLVCGADEAVFAWDGDSFNLAMEAALQIAPIIDRAGAVRLPAGADPDTMGGDAVRALPVTWV